jgi:hypothetical protein
LLTNSIELIYVASEYKVIEFTFTGIFLSV